MEVTIDSEGETNKTATVDQNGRIYIGTQYEGEQVEYSFEVQE